MMPPLAVSVPADDVPDALELLAPEAMAMLVIVVGARPVIVVVEVEDVVELEEPPAVMLNWLDCARMAAFDIEVDMRLIWNAVPIGQGPLG